MITCTACGTQNEEGGQFCRHCGAPLAGGGGHPAWLLVGGIVLLLLGVGAALIAVLSGASLFGEAPALVAGENGTATATGDASLLSQFTEGSATPLLTPTSTPERAQEVIVNPTPTAVPATSTVTATSIPTATPTATTTTTLTPSPTGTATPTATAESSEATTAVTVTVPATISRTNTGVIVEVEQEVSIEYVDGSWRAGPPPTWPLVGPEGDPQVASKVTFPNPEAPIVSLVAGVGESSVLAVGNELQFTAETSGELWLGPNDDDVSDNEGQLVVQVSLPGAEDATASSTEPRFFNIFFCPEPCHVDGGNAATTLASSRTVIYVHWEYENVPPGAHYERIWQSNGETFAAYDCSWDGPSSGMDSVTLSEPAGLRAGVWEVIFRIEDEEVARSEITLTGNETNWDPVGTFDTCYGKR